MHTPADYQKLLDVAISTFAPDHEIEWRAPLDSHKEEFFTKYNEPAYYEAHLDYRTNPAERAVALTEVGPPLLKIPKPISLTCLFVALHEVGHAALARNLSLEKKLHHKQIWELCANMWAKGYMEAHGLQVPASMWHHALELASEEDFRS